MKNIALIVIDMQKGFDEPYWGERNNPMCEKNVESLISKFRELHFPIIHVKHDSVEEKSPLRTNYIGNEYKDEAQPLQCEKQFSKSVNSAFIGTKLEKYLVDQCINTLGYGGLNY